MKYLLVKEFAEANGIPERTVRDYCVRGKIQVAFLMGEIWNKSLFTLSKILSTFISTLKQSILFRTVMGVSVD